MIICSLSFFVDFCWLLMMNVHCAIFQLYSRRDHVLQCRNEGGMGRSKHCNNSWKSMGGLVNIGASFLTCQGKKKKDERIPSTNLFLSFFSFLSIFVYFSSFLHSYFLVNLHQSTSQIQYIYVLSSITHFHICKVI